ncbi:lysozyme inhibitor LprI family protein [Paramixta manurensis]
MTMLILLAGSALASEPGNLLTGPEMASCQKKETSNGKGFADYVSCMQEQEQKTSVMVEGAYKKLLSITQSDEWLLPNVDYSDVTSPIVTENKNNLTEDQRLWIKHKSLFCGVSSSQTSSSAPMHAIYLLQCKVNLNKNRLKEFDAVFKQLQ